MLCLAHYGSTADDGHRVREVCRRFHVDHPGLGHRHDGFFGSVGVGLGQPLPEPPDVTEVAQQYRPVGRQRPGHCGDGHHAVLEVMERVG